MIQRSYTQHDIEARDLDVHVRTNGTVVVYLGYNGSLSLWHDGAPLSPQQLETRLRQLADQLATWSHHHDGQDDEQPPTPLGVIPPQ